MRKGIYYRKCDQPVATLFKDKYITADITPVVAAVVNRVMKEPADEIHALNCDGNHYAYRVNIGGRQMLFRGDTTQDDDEYMLAEVAFIKAAANAGVPVPQVYACDVTMEFEACRWQLLEWIPGKALVDFDRRKCLDRQTVAAQLGVIFRRLHSIPMDGFGFANTEVLKQTGRLQGIYTTYPEYFHCRLDEHLDYLLHEKLLPKDAITRVVAALERLALLLERRQVYVVHRDPAFWNIIGGAASVAAIIDWDDAVSGDPADDIGLMMCFESQEFVAEVLKTYGEVKDDFMARAYLHFLRNMLWKMVIRHRNGYFRQDSSFFLNVASAPGQSLYDVTLGKIMLALRECEKC